MNIHEIIETLNDETLHIRNNRNKIREYVPNMNKNDFIALIKAVAEHIMAKRGKNIDFVIDSDNSEILELLYLYAIGSLHFPGDLNKGILLMGNIGTGKTLIMLSFFEIIERCSQRIITKLHSKALASKLRENGLDYYMKKPLFIDDIGKETKEVKEYGTIINPVPDLISLRYDFGTWTFGTCNYKSDELLSFYGETILDRFKDIFNTVSLSGNSRRS